MHFDNQQVIPAARTVKQFDEIIASPFDYIVLLEVHISLLMSLKREAQRHGKKLIIHADLIHGLKTDNFAADFLCNDIRPAGIISTRSNMLMKAKARGIMAIQRVFLIDTIALEKSYSMIETAQPDYIELLPGIIPTMIQEIHERTQIPVITGGLVRTVDNIEEALAGGAIAVTTSNRQLWENFKK
ncbi:glycerol-3-phosphate responsive antiterminator [Lysinibacillus sp. FSL M8-0216]|uniref:Glycerol uptake operon antiterminator regulatory protein n=1 Tax=Lysinibacillus fusiformis TaxID=28031 RepID=A0A1H9PA44_9BACI|nr:MULTISPECIES: glycerol-3-phosphate responsive antiterminator [Lysinibacillus]EAZ87834.1 transcription antiterminator [Bacillus sp. B14905]MCG7437021.1 glycerol-3-phosphate responsive antiterminator [Lysinibacillus fusiformis]MED4075427.1 glycerol-3-phosphate responsive antiterminator [Lysinibacillus fusiformis]MED4671867.1 glycerol-3-phosphate responsive antiterminator [Lysinibacillus fusiformis]NOG29816.1 glycerol-3-phosphate responsive antiterminator [Lysinibacillus fusiformis]